MDSQDPEYSCMVWFQLGISLSVSYAFILTYIHGPHGQTAKLLISLIKYNNTKVAGGSLFMTQLIFNAL